MLIFEDFVLVACIYVWAAMLGIVDVKLYMLMGLWVLLTVIISSQTALKVAFLSVMIMAWALLVTIVFHLAQGLCRRVINWLRICARRAHAPAAAAAA